MSESSERPGSKAPQGRVRRREFLKGVGAAAASTSLLGAALKPRTAAAAALPAPSPLEPPAGAERVFASADNEGLINVHVANGRIIRVSSLDYPNNVASPMALNWHHRTYAPDRILYPMVRADWKPGAGGTRETRGAPRYRRVSWDVVLDLVAQELKRVKTRYGNEGIFGGMIGGWSTTGLLNTKTGQLGRFLSLYGGYTSRIGNKSYAAWQWAAPYSWGVIFPDDSWADTVANSNLVIVWGSDPMNVQKVVGPLQGRTHEWIAAFKQRGGKLITIDPVYTETAEVSQQWIPIRPGTDSALIAAMAYVMLTENLYNKEFIDKYTVGFEPFRQYVMGETDTRPKTPEWAAALTDVPADQIRALAHQYARTPRLKITTGFGIQRQDHGE
ncbi:MAG TPA: molybdopterin-dependent oxidoreductase, partial [bacterium]|nr:molybdopterin-dependent oxidoreductase [bacterium]